MNEIKELQKDNNKNIHKAGSKLPNHLICFSHLRWNFVYQRPQHLLSRLSGLTEVVYIEEPVFDSAEPHYVTTGNEGVQVITPHLPHSGDDHVVNGQLENLLNEYLAGKNLDEYIFWYYTPMALSFTRHLNPAVVVFDCMDELSAFKFAPQNLKDLEKELLEKADVVFTGGHSLYNAKKDRHHNIHPFPSSIDKAHFAKARNLISDPVDQQAIPHPRLGFYGVIDERFDLDLIKHVAELRPDWQIVLIGPVVKIDPATLPKSDNIHYLGGKTYAELPQYLAGWDIALIPFQLNESTQFISPTKTPEYLAAGVPVISTAIADVINPYGDMGLVSVIHTPDEFIIAAENILSSDKDTAWLKEVDNFLAEISWDQTVREMADKIEEAINITDNEN